MSDTRGQRSARCRLDSVTELHVAKYVSDVRSYLLDSTINKNLTLLSTLLHWARRLGWAGRMMHHSSPVVDSILRRVLSRADFASRERRVRAIVYSFTRSSATAPAASERTAQARCCAVPDESSSG